MKPERKFTATEIYALAFGLFLGLAFWKFGNPVILDHKIIPPSTPAEVWADSWPTHWFWTLPLLWLGWQLISASQTVDADLTAATLRQFFGCVACYYIGALVLSREAALRWLLVGVLAAFAFCLVRAVDQRLVEFPQSHQMLVEG